MKKMFKVFTGKTLVLLTTGVIVIIASTINAVACMGGGHEPEIAEGFEY